MTVFENVLVAAQAGAGLRSRSAHKLAYSVLEETGLVASGNRRTATLGLLQRKRLELAKALATRPRLLLLDEVAAGLTDPEVDELIGIVTTACERRADDGLAIIWVEHVVRALVRTVSRMICLDAGRIVADGSPEAVMGDEKVREVYLGAEIVTATEASSEADQGGRPAAASGSTAGR